MAGRGRAAAAALALAGALAGCALPEPDGLEADLIARSEGLAEVAPGEGAGPRDAVRRGLLLSPEVRAAASEVSAAAAGVRIARAGRFPRLALAIGGGVGAASSGAARAELRGSQLVFDGGRTDRAVTTADIDMRLDYIAFRRSVDEAAVEALVAYDAVRTRVDLLAARRAQRDAVRDLRDRVARRVGIGAAPRSDLLEVRIRERNAEFEVRDAELALAEARDRLAELTGLTQGGEAPSVPAGSCAPPPDAGALLTARLDLARAELALAEARTARRPSVSVEPVVRSEEARGVRAGLDVAVNSDLLQGGALSAAVEAAENDRDAAAAAVEAAGRDAFLSARRSLREIAAAEERRELLRGQIALLDEARALYRNQYLELGTRRLSELLDNEEAFHERRVELIELRAELLAERLECAAREDRLRALLGLDDEVLYGLPLAPRT